MEVVVLVIVGTIFSGILIVRFFNPQAVFLNQKSPTLATNPMAPSVQPSRSLSEDRASFLWRIAKEYNGNGLYDDALTALKSLSDHHLQVPGVNIDTTELERAYSELGIGLIETGHRRLLNIDPRKCTGRGYIETLARSFLAEERGDMAIRFLQLIPCNFDQAYWRISLEILALAANRNWAAALSLIDQAKKHRPDKLRSLDHRKALVFFAMGHYGDALRIATNLNHTAEGRERSSLLLLGGLCHFLLADNGISLNWMRRALVDPETGHYVENFLALVLLLGVHGADAVPVEVPPDLIPLAMKAWSEVSDFGNREGSLHLYRIYEQLVNLEGITQSNREWTLSPLDEDREHEILELLESGNTLSDPQSNDNSVETQMEPTAGKPEMETSARSILLSLGFEPVSMLYREDYLGNMRGEGFDVIAHRKIGEQESVLVWYRQWPGGLVGDLVLRSLQAETEGYNLHKGMLITDAELNESARRFLSGSEKISAVAGTELEFIQNKAVQAVAS